MNRQIAGHAGMTILVAALSGGGCIVPPQAAQCPCSTTTSSTTSSGSSAAASSTASSNGPAAVKPTGALVSDGKSAAILDVNPPGSWFAFNDRTAKGTMSPASTSDFPSALVNGAVHTSGKGFADWGGGIGFNFVGADSLTPLDASEYAGISFKASGSSPMHVGLATKATMPEFGECTKCYDHFAVDITDLTSTPKVYTFKWSQLRSGGWGSPRASLDPHTLVGLNFTSKGAAPWDFAIHEISFFQ